MRLRNLMFEDFLEALVRLACIAALPTDAEIFETDATDAGEYLLALRSDPLKLQEFIASRKVGWQREPRQKVHRCVSHLLSYLVRVIESNAGKRAVSDMRLTEDEVEDFDQQRRKGASLSQLANASALLDGIQAAASICRARLLTALRNVGIFSVMSDRQLETLRDAMIDAPFEHGQFVFEQGEEGDAFYVVIEGECEALREQEDGQLLVLATIGEGGFFGERALLKNQVSHSSADPIRSRFFRRPLPCSYSSLTSYQQQPLVSRLMLRNFR